MSDAPEVGAPERDEIHLTLPALPEYARIARLAITGLAARMDFTYDEIEDLRIAVGEICNVLLDASGGRLAFRCVLEPDELTVEAVRKPLSAPLTVTDLTRQILAAVLDEIEIDAEQGALRAIKRRAHRS